MFDALSEKLVSKKDIENWMKTNKKIIFVHLLDLDQPKRPLSFNETDITKNRPISPSRHLENTTADERVSFTLEKEIIDDEKDEIVYSSTSNIM